MPKSKYPQQLDTSIEIPPVRDNITEIGSDVINSIRSAIFKIESTLGINPQGSAGNTLSERINKSLDSNGNILDEALSRANVLSGPIIDSDVSKVASISESKLRLDYPTTLLQDEISILNNNLDLIRSGLEELSTTFSIHVEPTSTNRHSATSIAVSQGSVIASDIAGLSLAANTLQVALEGIYNSHINYTGANISALNNSHLSSQIFYDTTNTSEVIFSNDLQGAIDDLANIETVGFKNTILNISSNGRVRTGSTFDGFEGNNLGSLLLDLTSASYIQSSGSAFTTFSLTTGETPLGDISEFDILTLSGLTSEDDNREYQISEVTIDTFGLLQSVIVHGGPLSAPESGLLIKISKNTYKSYNLGGFISTVRPRANKTNTPDVQVLNPDSSTIISSGIIPSNITSSSGSFDITIDGGTPVTIDTYNSSVSEQSIDSIMQSINDIAVDSHLNITAYKVIKNQCYELALSHNMPNISGDSINRTILVSLGSSNDGTAALGLSSLLDIEFEGETGNSLNLNGNILSGFGLVQSFDNSSIEMISGTLTLSLFDGNLSSSGIREGDIAIVTGSTGPIDDGSYRVGSVLLGVANLDLSGTTFSGALDDDSLIHFIRATSNVGELTFEEILSIDGTIIFDTFLSEEKNIFNSKRLEIESSLRSGTFFASVSDISRGFITSGEVGVLTIESDGFAKLTGPDLLDGSQVFVGASGSYKIFGSDGLSFITLDVSASAPPLIQQQVTLYGFNEISQNNYHLSRGGFSTSLGRILGSSTDPGIPVLTDKRRSGTSDATIIGDSFIEKFIEGPRNEIRASGIVRGCLVSNPIYIDTGTEVYQTFSVGAGIPLVNGIRFEFPGQEDIRVNTDSDYYVIIDSRGCVVAKPAIDNPNNPGEFISPFFDQEVATLSEVVNDGFTATEVDLRLFIDNLDLKVLGDIKVSVDPRHGHFTSISDAVKYSNRFRKMFPTVGRPSILIENGSYEVSSTIVIDFDLSISGSGPGTIIKKSGALALGTSLSGDNVDLGTALFMLGSSSDTSSADIIYGISVSNFTYQTDSSLLDNVGCVIALTQALSKSGSDVSREASFKIQNIIFDGPSTIDGVAVDPNRVGEYAMIIGQQNSVTLIPESDLEMGNLIFSGCRLNNMGLENGAIKFTESSSSTMKDIIISNNIITNSSPNLGSNSSIVIEYPSVPVVDGIIEISNTVRTST